ncbi:MAG TPA: DNA polymerase III subunit delta [Gemmatimonadaceae bacterium]|jgi:DNA polymerase-3 subunit delta|nr:DNA polymerase III subunit delta [Gemmatimonadaceae bacterium]
MASAGEKALHAALKKRVFDPVYYLVGEDDFQKERASRQLADAAADPATRDFNLEIRRSSELDAETLDALLSTPPMLAERRVVVLRDVDKLKKGPRELLERYLARPAADTVLILVWPSGVKAEKALSDHATLVDFAPLDGERLPKWVTYHAQTLGRAITPEAVALLVEATGGELAQLAIELEKLASYAPETIDEAAVAAVVGVRRGESLGDLLDAVAERDAGVALGLIPLVLQQPKITPVSIVMALTAQTLALGYAEAALSAGVAHRALYGELMALLRETGAYPHRPWGEAVGAWTKHAARWSAADVDAAVDALLTADVALKETRISSPEQLLTNLVLALCGRTSRRAA